jgi:purine catabolism regulator
VGSLLGFPHLGLTVRGGSAGLDRHVTWAHASELEDPVPFLEGGELILTGGIGIPGKARGQVAYLKRLDARGVAGVAIAQGPRAPRLTKAAIEQADELGFPVLELPVEVPFLDIERLVAAASEPVAHQRLLNHLQIFESLQMQQATSLPPRDFISRLSGVSGLELYVSAPDGASILPDVPTPPKALSAAIARVSSENPTVPGGYCVPVAVAGRTAARLVALRKSHDHPTGLATAQHIATVIGVLIAELYQRREASRREGAEVFAELLSGGQSDAERKRRLTDSGFDPKADLVIVVIRTDDLDFDDAEVHHRLCDKLIPSLLITRGDLVLLVQAEGEAVATIEAVDFDLTMGVSAPFGPGAGLGVPWREARWSLERAMARGQRAVRFSVTDTAAAWLPLDHNVLVGVVEQILGPVRDYDQANGTELIESLRVLFRNQRRMKAAAAELGIHHHTLAYRLQTVERLTDRKLRDLHDLVDLWLSLRGLDLLAEEASA